MTEMANQVSSIKDPVSRASVSSPGSLTIPRKLAQQVGARLWLVIALGTVVSTTGLLYLQHPWTHIYSHAPGARSWWLESIEWNSMRGLPEIIGNINAVAIQPGSFRVWIAGEVGLLAFSDDVGKHWTKLDYDAPTGTFSVGGTQANAPAQSSMFGVPMRVEAATLPSLDDKKPPDSSATQQSAAPRQANAPNTDSKGQSIPNQQNRTPVQQSPIQQNAAPNANSQTTNQDQTNLTTVPT